MARLRAADRPGRCLNWSCAVALLDCAALNFTCPVLLTVHMPCPARCNYAVPCPAFINPALSCLHQPYLVLPGLLQTCPALPCLFQTCPALPFPLSAGMSFRKTIWMPEAKLRADRNQLLMNFLQRGVSGGRRWSGAWEDEEAVKGLVPDVREQSGRIIKETCSLPLNTHTFGGWQGGRLARDAQLVSILL